MTATNTHTVCWVELGTSNTDDAMKFYSELFGWTTIREEMSGDCFYTMMKSGDTTVGGAYKLQAKQIEHGVPSHWMPYIAVENIEESTQRAKSLGAEIKMGPMDVMKVGRMTVIADPTGATIAMWQALGDNNPSSDDKSPLGTRCWSELITDDIDRAKAFYSELFGWKHETSDMGSTAYTVASIGDKMVGGILAKTPDMGPMPSAWINYFTVESCDGAVARANSVGGKALMPAIDMTGVGRFTWLTDPQGAMFGILQSEG